jgi:hypothetical protein
MARFTQGGSSNFGGAELNYIQVVGTQQVISSAPNAIVDLDITTTGKAVQISVTGEGANASAGSWLRLNLFRDNVEIGNAIQLESSAVSENVPFAINFIDDVPAGTYNYSARVTSITGGSWTFGEAAGPVINAVELTGFKGDRGPRGFRGDQGEPGVAGATGADGQDGVDGLSAYEIAVENGFVGTEQEWLDSLGGSGTADIADFVFDLREANEEEDISARSTMTIHNHDMRIRTTRDDVSDGETPIDADIRIISADDFSVEAEDEVEIRSNNNNVSIVTNNYQTHWTFETDGGLRFPDGTTQTTAYVAPETEIIPLPDFLTYVEGRAHLPNLNANFGWDSNGVYFGPTSDSENEDISSYPVFTDFTIPETTPVSVEFDMVVAENCADAGVAFYVDGIVPGWAWGPNTSRIAAQFDCLSPELSGINTMAELGESSSLPGPGTYRVIVNYVPGEGAQLLYGTEPQQLGFLELAESLPTGDYRIGFASDNDRDDEGDSSNNRTYIKNLTITLNPGTEGEVVYTDTLTNGNSGAPITTLDLVVPVAIKDGDGDDFITFTRTSTGTARIGTPQDDLSLRSARDITLFAGNDGPGNVYIGWGDAVYTPDSPNRVATIGDIQNANTGDITFVESTISNDTGDDIVIQNKNEDGIVKASIRLDQSNEQVLIEAIASDSDWFSDSQWSGAVWTGSVVTIVNTPDIINFIENAPGNITRVSINNGGLLTYEGAGYGPSDITINVGGTPPEGQDPLVVTEIRFYYSLISRINIDHDDSEFEIISRGMSMTIDSSGDLELKARDEDLHLYANDDVRFTTNWNNNGTEQSWRMSEIGRFELPGAGYIENPINSSGDGGNNDTIKIVPDANLLEDGILNADQYLIIDPTGPNHIHVRSGGTIDESTADIIIGGERNKVQVSDSDRSIYISTRAARVSNEYINFNETSNAEFITTMPASIEAGYTVNVEDTDYEVSVVVPNSPTEGLVTVTAAGLTFAAGAFYTFVNNPTEDNDWEFDSDGVLTGPAMGGIRVTGLEGAGGNPLYISSVNGVVLSGNDAAEDNGVFLNNTNPENQVATIGDISNVVTAEIPFTVNGGTLGNQPTFDGNPLFSGTYVKTGPMVHFQIQVDMDNILTFGTGQYFVELPFYAKYGYQFKNGCLHDISTGNQFAIGGHVAAGSNQLLLSFTGSNGQDEIFDFNSPVTLTNADNFHISGDYIISDVD